MKMTLPMFLTRPWWPFGMRKALDGVSFEVVILEESNLPSVLRAEPHQLRASRERNRSISG